MRGSIRSITYGISEGVTGSEGGGGRLIKVGADMLFDFEVVSYFESLKVSRVAARKEV